VTEIFDSKQLYFLMQDLGQGPGQMKSLSFFYLFFATSATILARLIYLDNKQKQKVFVLPCLVLRFFAII
jgi:hypothetical protein